ncbi:MAG: type II toxin-antitoxin system RelE/ParE family toxin [Acidobacteriota bacterium]
MQIHIIKTPIFVKLSKDILSSEEMETFQKDLAANPEKGTVIKGSKGLRKIRVAISGKGKSGGARIIYYLKKSDRVILLLYIYKKNVQADLTKKQTETLIKLVEEYYG